MTIKPWKYISEFIRENGTIRGYIASLLDDVHVDINNPGILLYDIDKIVFEFHKWEVHNGDHHNNSFYGATSFSFTLQEAQEIAIKKVFVLEELRR
jgi:hypothetical protein